MPIVSLYNQVAFRKFSSTIFSKCQPCSVLPKADLLTGNQSSFTNFQTAMIIVAWKKVGSKASANRNAPLPTSADKRERCGLYYLSLPLAREASSPRLPEPGTESVPTPSGCPRLPQTGTGREWLPAPRSPRRSPHGASQAPPPARDTGMQS